VAALFYFVFKHKAAQAISCPPTGDLLVTLIFALQTCGSTMVHMVEQR